MRVPPPPINRLTPSPSAEPRGRTRSEAGAPPRASRSVVVQILACTDAGDRAAASGDRAGALSYYGEALDGCLREGLLVIAASVAQRMVERYPDVVRARMTLAMLSLAEGLRILSPQMIRSTCSELEDYTRIAREAGQTPIAVGQLRRIAAATESTTIRQRIADLLHDLGDAPGAESVFLPAYEEQEGLRPARHLEGDQRTRWIEILVSPSLS